MIRSTPHGKLTIVDPTNPTWRPTFSSTDDPDVFAVDAGVRESGESAFIQWLPDGRVASMFFAAQTWTRPVRSPEVQVRRRSGGTIRPLAESSISVSSRRSRVSGRFALITQ